MAREILRDALKNPNVEAFRRTVVQGESSQDDRGYYMRYGGYYDGKFQPPKYFEDLSRHPQIFELTKDGRKSSAAGKYQATYTTWSEELARWKWPDFSKQSQDEFFVARLIYRGALDEVMEGKFDEACRLCKDEWTSLPGGDEENAATREARATYVKWGGKFAPVVVDDPLKTEHYGEAVTESVIRPIPSVEEQEANMAPFLAAAWPALVSAAPDLIRLLSSGKRGEQNAVIAEKVGAVAMKVTGAVNEQEAARKISTDPLYAKAFRAEVAENFDQWMGMVTRFHEMDEVSRDKARTFAMEYSRHPVVGRLTFVELLSLLYVGVAAVGGGFVLWDPLDKFTTEMQMGVVMLMLIGGWNGVKEFWYGSSMGSMRKDERNLNQSEK